MASSLISSSHHVDFDSVFGMDDAALVQMFESLIATGLKEFLGCPAVFYEAALTEFFTNGSVREEGMVVSTIRGTTVENSESMFVTAFDLPTEGLTDLSDVPKNLVFDARSLFSESKDQVSISCLKKELKIQYHLLHDILAKTIYVKAGSFDTVTRDRFMLMTAITCDVKVNWSNLLFSVFEDMVTPGTRKAKGFTIQISVLLKNVPGLDLGESRVFPIPRILIEKTVHRFVAINEKVGVEDVTDEPRVRNTPVKKAVSQKIPAVGVEAAPVVKKKRTTKGKPVIIAQEAVPLQIVEATTDAPVEQPNVAKIKSQKRKRRLVLSAVDETVDTPTDQPDAAVETTVDEHPAAEVESTVVKQPAVMVSPTTGVQEPVDENVEGVVEPVPESMEQPAVTPVVETATDDPNAIIEQVLDQLDSVAANQDSGDQPTATIDETIPWTDAEDYLVEDSDEEPVPETEKPSADEAMYLEDILMTIPVGVPLPSVGVEITRITLGKEIHIPGVTERTWYLAGLPQIPVDDKGKEPLLQKYPVKGNPVQEQILLIVADVECLVQLREKVIGEVEEFFHSFSRLKWAKLQQEDFSAKIEKVLTWAETDSTIIALQRKAYVLLKYREMLLRKFIEARILNFVPGGGESATDLKILDRLSVIHFFVLEELKYKSQEHGLRWDSTCCSKLFEGRICDRGAVIARSNTKTKSSCWIRTMLLVDGTWVIEPCADYWKPIPRAELSSMVIIPSRISYMDTLPPMPEFFKLLRKRWADVCIEVAQFFASWKLLPVASINFCRGLSVVEPVASFAPRSRLFLPCGFLNSVQFFIEYRFFSSLLSTVDFSSLRSVVIADRGIDITVDSGVQRSSVLLTELLEKDVQIVDSPVFESQNVQIDQNSALVAPFVQLLDENLSSASSSETSSMRFDGTDVATTALSLPATASTAPDVTEALNQLQASIEHIREKDDDAKFKDYILMHLCDIEKNFTAHFDSQDRVLGVLHTDSNDQRTLLSLETKSLKGTDLLRLSTQLGDIVDYLRGGDAKKGEGSSSRRPLPTPAHESEGSGDVVRTTDISQQDIDHAQRDILERMMRADRERERENASIRMLACAKRQRIGISRWSLKPVESYSGLYIQTKATTIFNQSRMYSKRCCLDKLKRQRLN
ncbi:hypothetical protein F511_31581 [Dorcoceras hygrometricum]|uniref:Dystroglycan-like n=1 Tax=Dorcoceras hygrometricum TaxID=472368 RepID=A0A2Z7CSB8_9LAMI|nr:hypothetical protein F511_31581 [Dorcoceras hygrometricum]